MTPPAQGTNLDTPRPDPAGLDEAPPTPPRRLPARALAFGMFVSAGVGTVLAIAAVIVLIVAQPTGRALTATGLAGAFGAALTLAGVLFGSTLLTAQAASHD